LAKKRRQKTEKKDEPDFKLPEFDEHEYIALELRKSKLAFLAFIFAIIMVIITYLLYSITYPDWRGPIVMGVLAVAALPFIVNVSKLDTTDLDWKNWFGGGAIYILTWLAIFILVCNPPFSDFADPEIDEDSLKFFYIKVDSGADNWTRLNIKEDSTPQMFSPIKIKTSINITDNTEIDIDSVFMTITPSIFNNASQTRIRMEHKNKYTFEISITSENATLGFRPDTFTYSIEAKDINGHKKAISGKFKIERV